MRIPSLLGLFIAVCVATPAHAELSLNDLPYVQGTPIADQAWVIQDYSQQGDGIHWVWLQYGSNSAYVVYPSEEATLLPDNSVVPPNTDQMTLRFLGEPDRELLFTRFGTALITLIGSEVQVTYTAVTANTATGAYPGDLSMTAAEIHMEGELNLNGDLALSAEETVGVYGSIDVRNQLSIEAATAVIVGSVKNNQMVLNSCTTANSAAMVNISIQNFLGSKNCVGDLFVLPETTAVLPEATADQGSLKPASLQTGAGTAEGSKGGSTAWLLLVLIASLAPLQRIRTAF